MSTAPTPVSAQCCTGYRNRFDANQAPSLEAGPGRAASTRATDVGRRATLKVGDPNVVEAVAFFFRRNVPRADGIVDGVEGRAGTQENISGLVLQYPLEHR